MYHNLFRYSESPDKIRQVYRMGLETANLPGVTTKCQGRELGNIHVIHIVLLAKLLFYNRLVTVILYLAVGAHMEYKLHTCPFQAFQLGMGGFQGHFTVYICLLYTSPSPRDS